MENSQVRSRAVEIVAAEIWNYSEWGEYPTWEEITDKRSDYYDPDIADSCRRRASAALDALADANLYVVGS